MESQPGSLSLGGAGEAGGSDRGRAADPLSPLCVRSLWPQVGTAWGQTQTLYRDIQIALALATIRRGGYSSRHHHRFAANGFLVTLGQLLVISYLPGGQIRRILVPGDDLYTIPAGVDHRFFAIAATTVAELYYAVPGFTVSPDDIVRRDSNGVCAGDVHDFRG
jgi:mannose-6-phosphate isomerase-like protein (cupin superfamily)